jgi:hypothetical protein
MAAFFETIHQDPVISQVKLIAEPWDVGEGGYHVGNFPVLWAEWNGRYRDSVRRFWKGDNGLVGEIAYRLSGSSDLRRLANGPMPASTLSPPTTVSRSTISSATTRNTTKPTAMTTATVTTITTLGTAALKGQPKTRKCFGCGSDNDEISWPQCSFPRVCRCFALGMNAVAPSSGTTTPIARIPRSAGTTGSSTNPRSACFASCAGSSRFGGVTL